MDPRDRIATALSSLYDIGDEIGSGGWATVYLAEDRKHARKVAVKVFRPELCAILGSERFLAEIRVTANLRHPHILPLYDSGEADGLFYFVMPFVEGENLRTRLEREKQLPLEEAVRITRQTADALEFAHRRGVIHRDVKPGNILLEAGHAVLADFGVAQAVMGTDRTRITKTGMSLGTSTYMSPEQASGNPTLDGRSDQYSLACVFYEMLVGWPPFTGPTDESVARQHLTADPLSVSQVRASIPERVEGALEKALAKAPADRFRSVAEFGRALGRRTESSWGAVPPTVRTERPGAKEVLVRASGRVPRGWWTAAGAAAALAAAVFVVQSVSGPRATPLSALAPQGFVDSVAVLPMTTHADDEYLLRWSSFITEEIGRQLQRGGLVSVRQPFSVESFLALNLTDRQLADSLGVGKLIHGSLYESADPAAPEVTVNLSVADVWNRTVQITETYEEDPAGGYRSASALAERFVSQYLAEYTAHVPNALHGPSPEGPGYQSFLIGNQWLGRRTPDGLARARAAFEDALGKDPDYAFAFSGLSRYYSLVEAYRYRTDTDGYGAAGKALALARRAIDLEPNLADAFSARVLIARRSFAPVEVAAADCRRAIELEPGAADGLSWCAATLRQQGESNLGYRAAEQATKMDPQNAGRRVALAYVTLALGDYDRTATEARMAWQLEPELMLPRSLEAWAYLLEGEPQRCAELELGPHAVVRATCLHETGRVRESMAIVDSVRTALDSGNLPSDDFAEVVRTGDLAVYYAWVGDAGESLLWLERSYQLSPSGVESRVYASELFDRLREDPTFVRAAERIHEQIWGRVQQAGEIAYGELVRGQQGP